MMKRSLLCLVVCLLARLATSSNRPVYHHDLSLLVRHNQLFNRLTQLSKLTHKACDKSRDVCLHCHKAILRYKKAREERQFQHLYPYVVHDQHKHLAVVSRGGGERDSSDAMKMAVTLGLVLAFNSGFINGCCLSGATTKQAVASVTRAYTNSAIGLASGNMSQFVIQLKVLLAYIFGSAVAGWMHPRPVAMKFTKSWQPELIVAGVLLTFASILASLESSTGYSYFLLAAMANGLQNSVTSSLTANLCRTTHYTGMSSDIGTFLGQMMGGNKANQTRLKVFAALAAAFWSGSFWSFFVMRRFQGLSLLMGAAIYFFVGSGLLQVLVLGQERPKRTSRGKVATAAETMPEERVIYVEPLPPPPSPPVPPPPLPLLTMQFQKGSLQSLARKM